MGFVKNLSPFLFIAFLLIVLFYKVIFLGEVFYYGDNFHLNIPLKSIFVSQIQAGKIPLWNPYLFIGIPYLADLNLGTFYPLNFLYFLFSLSYALTMQSILDLFLIAVFCYLFFRSFNISKIACLFGTIIFTFSGEIFAYINNVTILNVIVFIPIIFYFAKKFSLGKTIYFYFLTLAQFLQIISGHPQITYYTIFFVNFFLILFLPYKFTKKILFILFYNLFAILLSSFQLIPFFELVLFSNRINSNFIYSTSGSLSIFDLITFIFPTFYGSLLNGDWWGKQTMLLGYLGIPTLFFIFLGLRFSDIKEKIFYAFCAFLCFILALGKYTPLYLLFYYLIPGWRFFRQPSQILIFYAFFLSILAVFGFEIFSKEKDIVNRISAYVQKRVFIPLFILFAIILTIFLRTSQYYFWTDFLHRYSNFSFIKKFLIYDGEKLQAMFQGIFLNIILLFLLALTTLLLFKLSRKQRIKKYYLYPFLGLISLNLLFFDRQVLLTTNKNLYNNHSQLETKSFRILSLPVDMHTSRVSLPGANFFLDEAKANLSIYKGSTNVPLTLPQINGYASLIPHRFTKYLSTGDNVTGVLFYLNEEKKLNFLNVKYILSKDKLPSKNIKESFLNERSLDNYYLYENKNALPRWYFLNNSSKNEIKFISEGLTNIKFRIKSTFDNKFILSDQYYPGWKAYLDGKEVKIHSYLNTFRMVSVNKGTSEIYFIYQPISFYAGLIISFLSFAIFIISLLYYRIFKKI